MNIIIPMAGNSSRFYAAGYIEPKALLPVGDNKMIEHVINMFDPNICNYHIVVNSEQIAAYPNLIKFLKQLATNVQVIVIEKHDLGPVYSALQVQGIKSDEEIIVSYCDFFVQWNYPLFLRQVYGQDGCVVSFRGFHPASCAPSAGRALRNQTLHVAGLPPRPNRNTYTRGTQEDVSACPRSLQGDGACGWLL